MKEPENRNPATESERERTYGGGFYDVHRSGSLYSARAIVPLVGDWIRPQSVLDAGCGQGTWLAAWEEAGIDDIQGLDGEYVEPAELVIPTGKFTALDLSRPFDLGRRFDLVESLEVAEHLPETSADGFIESLTRHAPVVLFSAATPGQGGKFHVNEQPPAYWREKFAQSGYVMSDCLRPLIAGRRDIEPWYRYNSFLYIDHAQLGRMPEPVREAVNETGPIKPMSSLGFRARSRLLRLLPPAAVTAMAGVKYRVLRTVRRS